MGRVGVSYKDVAVAAGTLLKQGRNPTVEQVRLLLGTGSSTTIANYLRQWKLHQNDTSFIFTPETHPPAFTAIIKELWERMVDHAGTTMSDLQQEVQKYKLNNRRWQKLHEQWRIDKLKLEDAHTTLCQKHASLIQQLEEKQIQIEELHKLLLKHSHSTSFTL